MTRDAHTGDTSTGPLVVASSRAGAPSVEPRAFDVVCFSHLRWSLAFQRPQQLMTRFARVRRVFYVEEPVFDAVPAPTWELRRQRRVIVAVPHLPTGLPLSWRLPAMGALVDTLIATERIDRFVAWYYTPDSLAFTKHLLAEAVVYDWMDRPATRGATEGSGLEQTLMARADVVFTGGYSLSVARVREPHPPEVPGRPSRPRAAGHGPVLFAVDDEPRSRAHGVSAFARSRDVASGRPSRHVRADAAVRERSWEQTWTRMAGLVERAVERAVGPAPPHCAWPGRSTTSKV